ncbi:hypothetical protein LR69_01425 [Geobacillus sp. BCO2]|nr:hypothetical protein LR69_01425 [Geobacillus sp. BCO2]
MWDIITVSLLIGIFILFYEFLAWCDLVVNGGDDE